MGRLGMNDAKKGASNAGPLLFQYRMYELLVAFVERNSAGDDVIFGANDLHA